MMDLNQVLGSAEFKQGSKQEIEKIRQLLDRETQRVKALQRNPEADPVLTELVQIGRFAADAAAGYRGVVIILNDALRALGELALKNGATEEDVMQILETCSPQRPDQQI